MPKKSDEQKQEDKKEGMSRKEKALDERIRATIDAMSRTVSVDFNQHQIAASIYGRLEKWAAKNKIEDWDSMLPKYVTWVKQCSDARHARVKAFLEKRRSQKQNRISDTMHDAIYGG